MTPLEILIGARELLTPPENYTKGMFARDADGEEVVSTSPRAVCWCSVGALYKAGRGRSGSKSRERAFYFLELVVPDGVIPDWNDDVERTHAEILAGFDRAIELAKAQEAV